jgi:hypothetical protein
VRKDRYEVMRYQFDAVIQEDHHNEELYARIGEKGVRRFLKGRNITYMTYGPTGSGKTYCIFGEDLRSQSRGLMPRVLEQVFAQLPTDRSSYFKLSLSYVQVYLNQVQDLLSQKVLSIRENDRGDVDLKGMTLVELTSVDQAFAVIAK